MTNTTTMTTRYLKAIDVIKKDYPATVAFYLKSGVPVETMLMKHVHADLLHKYNLTMEELEYLFTVIKLQNTVES